MRQFSRYLCVIAIAGAAAGCSAGCGALSRGSAEPPPPATPVQRATATPGTPDAEVLADFNARIENFVKFQRALLDEAPLKESDQPQDIVGAQELLASKIRTLRKDAKQGDIISPQAAAMFRRLLNPELRGEDGAETRAILKDDGPTAVWLRVNATYPQEQPLSTVPANLLASLPQLPEDVEYRIVGRHLLLRDVDANIIVDFMYNAIP
jgi:hypothetical protein